MQASYPKRDRVYFKQFLRAMRERCVATSLGTQTYALLAVIISLEDDARYAAPVEAFAEQLMRAAGISSENTLIACRKRAVDAGWLHYSRGARGRGGSYYVSIPTGELTAADAGTCAGSR